MLDPLDTGGVFSLITRNKYAVPYDADLEGYELDELPVLLEEPTGKSGVFDADISFFTFGFLHNWLEQHGLRTIAEYGVFCLYNHYSVSSQFDDIPTVAKLHALEKHLGGQSPYRETARYIQIIAQKI